MNGISSLGFSATPTQRQNQHGAHLPDSMYQKHCHKLDANQPACIGPGQYWRFTGRGLTKSNIVIRPWPGIASLMEVYCGDATKQAKIYMVDSWKGIYQNPCQHFLYPEACFRGCAGSRGNLPRDIRETNNMAWPGQRKTISIQLNGS